MPLPPRHPLALLPTPLVEVPRLAAALGGPRLFLKRDDLTGFGGGGNKVRGLEFYLADALAQGADVIVTGAGPQSNHIRATAAAARAVGLDVVAVIHGDPPAEVQGNLLLDRLLDVETCFTHSPDRTVVDAHIEAATDELRRAGRRPYAVPRGGASALGALGYVLATAELNAQLQALGLRPDWLVLATGSGGTQAGLIAGSRIHGTTYRLLGITVSRPVAECQERITQLAGEAARLAGHDIVIAADDVQVRGGYIGAGYGVPTAEGIEAMRLAARTEGLFLDPTYTAKGMAGLTGEIRAGRIRAGETVVFLHTGGEPGIFGYANELGDSRGVKRET